MFVATEVNVARKKILVVLCRAVLNEREAPGKVVTARPPKRLAQLPSYHMPSFQLCRSTGQKQKN